MKNVVSCCVRAHVCVCGDGHCGTCGACPLAVRPARCREFLSLRVLGALVHSVCGRGHPGRPLRGGLAEAYCGPVYSRIPGPHKLRMVLKGSSRGPASWTKDYMRVCGPRL